MKKVTSTLMLLLALVVTSVWAQGPNNSGTYYQSADGKKGAALKTAFFNIIKNHTDIGYDGLIEAYHKTDTRADGKLRDWYSNATNYTWDDRNGNNREGAGWNREHSVPQSWFSKSNPMKSDIVHVLPTDCYVNNRRSSYPFGEVGNATYTSNNGYSKLGSCKTSGYSGTVFEPNDEIKGDIARIYFYMVTCYEDRFTGWTAGSATQVFSSNKYEGLKTWCMDMMMRWSKNDPVDAVETARNNAVQEVQGNRNPYVDYPGLEEYVWGSKKEEAFSYD
ncbi:MAG: endonuclease, partial [Prevotella sp.]|nr:endonuclease [Prevotella sp.]